MPESSANDEAMAVYNKCMDHLYSIGLDYDLASSTMAKLISCSRKNIGGNKPISKEDAILNIPYLLKYMMQPSNVVFKQNKLFSWLGGQMSFSV